MTQPAEPSLGELIEQARAATASAVADMGTALQEVQRESQALRAEWARDDERRAEQARAGELGPTVRRLQERVDLGETTWGAVISGADDSPEAEEARRQAASNSDEVAREIDAALSAESAEGRQDPREELLASMAQLRALAMSAIVEHGQHGERDRRGQ